MWPWAFSLPVLLLLTSARGHRHRMVNNCSTDDPMSGDHIVWRFKHTDDPNVITFFIRRRGHEPSRVDLHLRYIPVVACFGLEYWHARESYNLTQNNMEEGKKRQMFTRYLHALRSDFVDAILAAGRRELLNGSWKTHVIDRWAIRTWNNFSHSSWGRRQYKERCTRHNIMPYTQTLTTARESIDIHT